MAAYWDVKHAKLYNIAHINVRGCLHHPPVLRSHIMVINQPKLSLLPCAKSTDEDDRAADLGSGQQEI